MDSNSRKPDDSIQYTYSPVQGIKCAIKLNLDPLELQASTTLEPPDKKMKSNKMQGTAPEDHSREPQKHCSSPTALQLVEGEVDQPQASFNPPLGDEKLHDEKQASASTDDDDDDDGEAKPEMMQAVQTTSLELINDMDALHIDDKPISSSVVTAPASGEMTEATSSSTVPVVEMEVSNISYEQAQNTSISHPPSPNTPPISSDGSIISAQDINDLPPVDLAREVGVEFDDGLRAPLPAAPSAPPNTPPISSDGSIISAQDINDLPPVDLAREVGVEFDDGLLPPLLLLLRAPLPAAPLPAAPAISLPSDSGFSFSFSEDSDLPRVDLAHEVGVALVLQGGGDLAAPAAPANTPATSDVGFSEDARVDLAREVGVALDDVVSNADQQPPMHRPTSQFNARETSVINRAKSLLAAAEAQQQSGQTTNAQRPQMHGSTTAVSNQQRASSSTVPVVEMEVSNKSYEQAQNTYHQEQQQSGGLPGQTAQQPPMHSPTTSVSNQATSLLAATGAQQQSGQTTNAQRPQMRGSTTAVSNQQRVVSNAAQQPPMHNPTTSVINRAKSSLAAAKAQLQALINQATSNQQQSGQTAQQPQMRGQLHMLQQQGADTTAVRNQQRAQLLTIIQQILEQQDQVNQLIPMMIQRKQKLQKRLQQAEQFAQQSEQLVQQGLRMRGITSITQLDDEQQKQLMLEQVLEQKQLIMNGIPSQVYNQQIGGSGQQFQDAGLTEWALWSSSADLMEAFHIAFYQDEFDDILPTEALMYPETLKNRNILESDPDLDTVDPEVDEE